MPDIATYAFHRVDAARRMMHTRDAAQATGRLFYAKRLHEAAKRGRIDLDAILREVTDALSTDAARQGAQDEHRDAVALFRGAAAAPP